MSGDEIVGFNSAPGQKQPALAILVFENRERWKRGENGFH